MRVKTELTEQPPVFIVDRMQDQAAITFYTDAEQQQRDDGETVWTATAWTIVRTWADNLADRVAADPEAWFAAASAECYEIAAAEARKLRDALLQASDAEMAIDRLGLVAPSGTTFTAWLSFLRGFGDVLTGKVAIYRQALRDIPQQAGFPYDVQWPEK